MLTISANITLMLRTKSSNAEFVVASAVEDRGLPSARGTSVAAFDSGWRTTAEETRINHITLGLI